MVDDLVRAFPGLRDVRLPVAVAVDGQPSPASTPAPAESTTASPSPFPDAPLPRTPHEILAAARARWSTSLPHLSNFSLALSLWPTDGPAARTTATAATTVEPGPG